MSVVYNNIVLIQRYKHLLYGFLKGISPQPERLLVRRHQLDRIQGSKLREYLFKHGVCMRYIINAYKSVHYN